MKKRRLKKWVRITLVIISVIAILVGISECENMTLFIISHIIAIVLFLVCSLILIKDMNKE